MIKTIVFVVFTSHAAMFAWRAYYNSTARNETDYLVAGISHLQPEKSGPLLVNPALVRMLATIPVLSVKPKSDWESHDASVGVRSGRCIHDECVVATATCL